MDQKIQRTYREDKVNTLKFYKNQSNVISSPGDANEDLDIF